ncbi:hypothetical protein ACTHGU_15740 [Chitinophagaceae bacterium MMS25-I14]
MRIFGIVLIVIGLFLLFSNGISFKTEKKVADIGPVEINKKETKHVRWPAYAGVVVIFAGAGLAIWGGKRK